MISDQHGLLDDAVWFETCVEGMTTIYKRDCAIAFNLKPVGLELEHQAAMIDRLEQTSTKERMNPDRTPDDSLG